MQVDYEIPDDDKLKQTLDVPVRVDTELKQLIVDYIGNKVNPEGEDVTLEQAIYLLCEEFPELVLPLAEENFMRGYKQAYLDLGLFEKNEQTDGVHTEEQTESN